MHRKVAIVINGAAGSGKDTFALKVLDQLAILGGWSGKNLSSIEPVRSWLRDNGVPVDNKGPAERDLMAEIKAALEKYDYHATKMVAQMAEDWLLHSPRSALCFVHIREPGSILEFVKRVRPWVQVRTLLIERPGVEPVTSNTADAQVRDMVYYQTINVGPTLETSRREAEAFAQKIIGEKP